MYVQAAYQNKMSSSFKRGWCRGFWYNNKSVKLKLFLAFVLYGAISFVKIVHTMLLLR